MKLASIPTAAAVVLLGLIAVACAQESELDKIRTKLAAFVPGLNREDVRPSAAPGIYEIQQGSLFGYVTADGKYLITGDMINLETGEHLTEMRRMSDRLEKLTALKDDQTIVFAPAKGADPKRVVTVFTDIDCGYCRKLHREIDDYLARGITIRYLFYPRSGPNTESFRKAEAVWCSNDRKDALTKAKQGAPLPAVPQCANPIADQYQLGLALGLRGTPMMILSDGDVVNGYLPADALAQRIDQIGKPAPVAGAAEQVPKQD